MRRKDRQMSEDFAMEIIDRAEFGVLGLCDGTLPYTVPLSFARLGKTLYFHGAKAGRKFDIIKNGDSVSVTFVDVAKVPSIHGRDEVKMMIEKGEFADLASSVYTTEFSSAHITGIIDKVEDEEEAVKGLKLLCKKYTSNVSDISEPVIKASIFRTQVYKIEIKEINGKRKAFDKRGKELKWERME